MRWPPHLPQSVGIPPHCPLLVGGVEDLEGQLTLIHLALKESRCLAGEGRHTYVILIVIINVSIIIRIKVQR